MAPELGAYHFEGPFWSMTSTWLSDRTAAAGTAEIDATSNLIGGGLVVSIYGIIHDATGGYALSLVPLAVLTVPIVGRQATAK